MEPAVHHFSISAVRADALFASELQGSQQPTAAQVRRAVAAVVRALGDLGCAERVAQEFGDHPELAAARMRWARRTADEAFGAPGREAARARRLAPRPAACARHAA
jgi:hypothetical protein